jgi:hypothetical protein
LCLLWKKKVSPEYNLLSIFPDIAAQFHPTKNSKKVYEYLPSARDDVWWICEFGHEWKARVTIVFREKKLIEIDGEQHRKSISYFGGQKVFEKIQRYDKMKNEHAKKEGIPLLRINTSTQKIRDEIQKFLS